MPALDLAWSYRIVPGGVNLCTHQSLPSCSWERGVPWEKKLFAAEATIRRGCAANHSWDDKQGALGAPVHYSPHYHHHTCNSDVFGSSSFGTPLGLLLGEFQGKVSLSLF